MEEHQEAGKESKPSCTSLNLQGDSSLQVEISDAVSERDKVKFTVQTKSCLPHFAQTEFSVVRLHEEFIWLHDAYVENEDYAGLIIPPAPPRPDFEASREKLQKLGEGDSSVTREEFAKMKQELEAEYLAIFKKTVAMHEVFLQRLAAHPTLRRDHNFFVFLEYGQDLSVRGKNRKELLGGFLRNIVKSADEALITGMSGLKEVDEFFEHERTFLLEYHPRIRDACLRADRVMHSHKCTQGPGAPGFHTPSPQRSYSSGEGTENALPMATNTSGGLDVQGKGLMEASPPAGLADDYIPISAALSSLGTQEVNQLKMSFLKLAELFERLRKLEGRVASDQDLKLSDMLRYYTRDSQAAKVRGGPRAELVPGGQSLYPEASGTGEGGQAGKGQGQGSCAPAGPRTCCTGGFGRWPTTRTPARHWTRRAPGTGRCGPLRATSSCAASASNAFLTQPSRVRPAALEPLPLGCPPCQGPHASPLQSSWTSSPAASPPSARILSSWRSWSSNMQRPAPCFCGTPLSSSKGNLRATGACSGASRDEPPSPPTTGATSQAPRPLGAGPTPCPQVPGPARGQGSMGTIPGHR
uniref:Sorting nexin 32 n=1 Tax=Sus scrofa TaxID=9823 RepID=A0A8D1L2P2_PIG